MFLKDGPEDTTKMLIYNMYNLTNGMFWIARADIYDTRNEQFLAENMFYHKTHMASGGFYL